MQTLILGLDAYDPIVFERLSAEDRLPNLTRYAEAGGYARFAVTNPPQSEVSWTSIATGVNPGGHGIFDFVHRDPANYRLVVSLLQTKQGLGGTQFVPPSSATTIFDYAARQGFPATALWWPATFPARPDSPVRVLPGLGTPDLLGRLGVGVLFSTDVQVADEKRKTDVVKLERHGTDRYMARLEGPTRKTRQGTQGSSLELQLDVHDDRTAQLTFGQNRVDLVEGQWSPVLELQFKVGFLVSVHAVTRAILTQVQPDVQIYFLPLQIHPLRPIWRYASPRGFVKQTWKSAGPFLTLGWPQDTTGLEDRCITDGQFLDLCASITETRERALMHHLGYFQEGILASVFDSLDRVQHMFRRDRPDIVEEGYVKLDAMVGRVQDRLAQLGHDRARIVVVSDHGFSDFDYKVHLNRWLLEQGYLVTREDPRGAGTLHDVDWSRTRAYAVGLNSLYLNVAGREGQGCVQPDHVGSLVGELRDGLLNWRGPDGRTPVRQMWRQEEAFEGPLASLGPDLVVGYAAGYRASAPTGLGRWESTSIELNRDHWGADHCIDAGAVPGVLFSNVQLSSFPDPSYRDFPALTIGTHLEPSNSAEPPSSSGQQDEDERVVEERLKGLGYL